MDKKLYEYQKAYRRAHYKNYNIVLSRTTPRDARLIEAIDKAPNKMELFRTALEKELGLLD